MNESLVLKNYEEISFDELMKIEGGNTFTLWDFWDRLASGNSVHNTMTYTTTYSDGFSVSVNVTSTNISTTSTMTTSTPAGEFTGTSTVYPLPSTPRC